MTSPLAGSLAKTIGKAMSGLFLNATYTVDAPSNGPAYDPGAPTSTDYPCKAIFDEWGAYSIRSGLVGAEDRKVLILAASLAVEPQQGGRIVIDAATVTIYSDGESQPAVSTDPAKAVWVCRART